MYNIVEILNEEGNTNLILNLIRHVTLDRIDDLKLEDKIEQMVCSLPITLPSTVIEWAILRVIYWEAKAKQNKDILKKFEEFTKPPTYRFFVSFMDYYNRFWPQDIKNKFEQNLKEEFIDSGDVSLIDRTTLCAHAFRIFMHKDAFFPYLIEFLDWVLVEKRRMNNILREFSLKPQKQEN